MPLAHPLSIFHAWFDETHVAIAKVVGYSKWFNAVGPDMIKEKMGNVIEQQAPFNLSEKKGESE